MIKRLIIHGLYQIACMATDEQYISWKVIRQAILDLGKPVGAPCEWPCKLPAAEDFFRSFDHAPYALQAGLDPVGINKLLKAGGLI